MDHSDTIDTEEDVDSKASQGGLLHRDRSTNKVTHYENKDYPQRCLVQLFKTYNSRCPSNCPTNTFYLKPLKHQKGDVWYSKSPVGHNILGKMIYLILNSANILRHFTNHSLRSTTTTLFNAHVDEQLIMSRTEHSITKGVRAYKKASE